jgi:hypothetical protein
VHLRPRLVVPALLACLLAGCGTPVDGTPSAAESTASAIPTTGAAPTTTEEPTTGPAPSPASTLPRPTVKSSGAAEAGPVTLLPWPTADPKRLQTAVDGGSQPWLLDPSDLADSYVSATYGWTAADATPRAGGTSARTVVDVRNADGARRTLTVAQPGRKGQGGIWLVTADARG